MFRTRPLRTLLLVALCAAPVLLGCSSSSSDSYRSYPNVMTTEGIVLEGAASDALLGTYLQHKARDWAWAGGQFDTPDTNATLAADTPTTFTWHADPADFAEGGAPGDLLMTHLLSFSTPRSGTSLRVFTTLREYTPDSAVWRKLLDAGEPISVSLTTGTFVGTDLPEDGGPFNGQTLTFTIE
jgi:hypothetical protein